MSAEEGESSGDDGRSMDDDSDRSADLDDEEIEWSTSEPEKTSKGLTTLQKSEDAEDE